MRFFNLHTLAISLSLASLSSLAYGAGFNLLEQSNSGLGNAYAGSAAIAENASTIYYNPAAMMKLDGLNISGGVSAIGPSFKFTDDQHSTVPLALAGKVPHGGNGGEAGGWALVPNLYASYKINEKIAVGLGISVPFGLKTEYDDNWVGRYHSRSFDIKTININPSVAFKLTQGVSLGLGLNVQHIQATYKKATPVPIPHPVTGQIIGVTNGDVKTKVSNTGVGFNVGLLFEPSDDTRIGISYRSRIKHKAKGDTDLDFTVLNPATGAPMSIHRSSDAAATVSLPDLAILSGYTRLNDKWELLGDISWTGWSSIPKLTIENKTLPTASLNLRFKDSWRVAVGANYQLNDSWKLKGGLAWDQSPVRSTENRPASLPDKDRFWLSFGVQYKPATNTTIDVAYTHLFASKAKVNNTNDDIAKYGRLSGSYKADANVIGIQVSHRF